MRRSEDLGDLIRSCVRITIEQHIQNLACPMHEAPSFCLGIRNWSFERAGSERYQQKLLRLWEQLIGRYQGAHGGIVGEDATINHSEALAISVVDQGRWEISWSR